MTFLPLCLLGALLLVDSAIAQAPSAPTTAPQNFAFTVRTGPSNCAPSSCTLFAGVNLNEANDSYVDIYLEGAAGGYVAVGFTATANMFSADVVACTREAANNMVRGLDSWNSAFPGRANQRDPTMEDDIVFHSGEFVGGRIRCTVSKRIIGSDENHDINLNTDLYIIRASGNTVASPTDLIQHNVAIGTSSTTFSFPPIVATDPPVVPTTMSTVDEAPPTPPDPPFPEACRLNFSQPANCDPAECDIFVCFAVNSGNDGYLDIYLEGEANGWVAVGFSMNMQMFSADVVACNRNPSSGVVEALDTQNLPSPQRGNTVDNEQDIVLFNGSHNNSRIRCTVTKKIDSGNDGDFNLDGNYHVLFARRQANSLAGAITTHLPSGRFVSTEQVNPARDSGAGAVVGISDLRHALTRVHGILMLIAWMLLFLPGIYFSTWMKWILPNGEWFQVHRALVISALFVALLAFLLIFIANKDNRGLIDLSSGRAQAHFALGIILMILMIANPIIALFRCKPDHDYRWIFKMIHGIFVGRAAETISFITVSLGLTLFGESFANFSKQEALWLYVAFAIFYAIFSIVNLIEVLIAWQMGAYKECESKKSKDTELQTRGGEEKKSDPDVKEPKTPAKDALARWILFAILLAVLVPVLIALIVLVALPPE